MRFFRRGKQQTEVRTGLSDNTISNIAKLNSGEFKGNGTPVWDFMGCFVYISDNEERFLAEKFNYRPLYDEIAVECVVNDPIKILRKGKCE